MFVSKFWATLVALVMSSANAEVCVVSQGRTEFPFFQSAPFYTTLTPPWGSIRLGSEFGDPSEVVIDLTRSGVSDGFYFRVDALDPPPHSRGLVTEGFSKGGVLGVPAQSGFYYVEARASYDVGNGYRVLSEAATFHVGDRGDYNPGVNERYHAAMQPLLEQDEKNLFFEVPAFLARGNVISFNVNSRQLPDFLPAIKHAGAKFAVSVHNFRPPPQAGSYADCFVDGLDIDSTVQVVGVILGQTVWVRTYMYFISHDGRRVIHTGFREAQPMLIK